MEVKLPPDLEILVKKRLSTGEYSSVEEVFRRALEARDAEANWPEQESLAPHVEQGFQQAERGELIEGAQARYEIQEMKDNWRQERASKR
jgi:Arc/MetJ-type ribon-helix-helix transcriptional regulator